MEGFEVFEKYHSRSVKEFFVTIQKRGTLSLNRASYRAMGSPEYAELLFNRSKRLIAIRPASAASGRTVPVRKQGHSDSYLIAGLTFTKEYDIDTNVARRFVATLEGDMLILDLNSPSTEATGPRSRSEDSEATQEELVFQLNHKTDKQESDATGKATNHDGIPTNTEATKTISKDVDKATTKDLIEQVKALPENERAAFVLKILSRE